MSNSLEHILSSLIIKLRLQTIVFKIVEQLMHLL